MFNNAFNSTINMHDYDRRKYEENNLAVQYGRNVCLTVILIILASHYSCETDKLGVQCPPNVCSTGHVKRCHPNPLPNFIIHGLWPKTISPRKNVTYDENVLKGQLLRDLHYYWPNLRKDYDKTFWAYEWVEHGPDYNLGDGSQLAYFNHTVNLFRTEALRLLGAEEKRYFKFNDTLEQLKNITTPELFCKKFEKEGRQLLLLIEIRFCLGNNLQNLTDCQPSNISASCNPEFSVYYLPPKK
ncbi:hypothetical protein FEM48_Zijuj01G0052400 [Ziziphus jujuba var. spinosa]|uniref:Uncharacterized protein n=1 Tax=Ziziphus jujuba var. spinosa TaxID=714518 RepID=A0A978VZB8_ZIZJJ|nr:hypothetical protein FEM48_Zijuj01G0052400 [Ziziphus jujuba var. spinosa]